MEIQQVMEILAEIRADRKADQEKAGASRQADRELLKGIMDANAKSIRQDIKFSQAEIRSTIDAWITNITDAQKKMTACQEVTRANPEKIEPNSGEEETVMELQEIPKEEVAVHSLRTCRSKTEASQEDTEAKPEPGMMQSVEEHQEIPKEEATVMPVGEPRKQHRDQNLAAGRRHKPKRRIQASCESRSRLTVAGKKITCRATVAWCKRNVFRRIVTQGNCGARSTLTATEIMMTRHAGVAWPSEKLVRKDQTRKQAEEETQKR
jgi:hypothetical protein